MLTLTKREIDIINRAITIAVEDRSIYGAAETKEEHDAVNDEIDAIREKLRQARRKAQ